MHIWVGKALLIYILILLDISVIEPFKQNVGSVADALMAGPNHTLLVNHDSTIMTQGPRAYHQAPPEVCFSPPHRLLSLLCHGCHDQASRGGELTSKA